VISVLVGGCATISGGKRQTIAVNANVPGATVFINNLPAGRTPFLGAVERDSALRIRVQKTGYAPQFLVLNGAIRPIFWGNILIGGTIGSSTDMSTGAMYEYSPASYYVHLTPTSAAHDYDQDADTAIQRYVMVNYQQLSTDIARGQGSRLDGLLHVLVEPESDRQPVADHLLQLWLSRPGPVPFGEAVAEHFAARIEG
jgi:hypothetical protein